MSDDPIEQATEVVRGIPQLLFHTWTVENEHGVTELVGGQRGRTEVAEMVAQALADAGLLPTKVERETRWVSLHTGEDAEEVHLRRYVTDWREVDD